MNQKLPMLSLNWVPNTELLRVMNIFLRMKRKKNFQDNQKKAMHNLVLYFTQMVESSMAQPKNKLIMMILMVSKILRNLQVTH